MNATEQAFKKCEDWYNNRDWKSKQTGVKMVVQAMLDKPEKIWWWSWEFVGQTTSEGDFLSHRSPARASDVAIYCPEVIEHRAVGRFKVYRLKMENPETIHEFMNTNQPIRLNKS